MVAVWRLHTWNRFDGTEFGVVLDGRATGGTMHELLTCA